MKNKPFQFFRFVALKLKILKAVNRSLGRSGRTGDVGASGTHMLQRGDGVSGSLYSWVGMVGDPQRKRPPDGGPFLGFSDGR
jgi:hypothetical protein